MPSPFSKTLRSIEGDTGRSSVIGALTIMLFAAAWAIWFVFGTVEIWIESSSARIESDEKAHAIQALVAGRIESVHAKLGQPVESGDVLVSLDSEEVTLLLDEQRSKAAFALSEVEALESQIAVEEQALQKGREMIVAVVDESLANQREKSAAAQIAETELANTERLFREGYIAGLQQERDTRVAEQRQAALQAASAGAIVAKASEQIGLIDRAAVIADLRRELAISGGQAEQAKIASARLKKQLSEHTIRSPVAGVVGELGHHRPQTVVDRGEVVARVVPFSTLHTVAYFTPGKSLGRIAPGSQGVFRADAYPWTQYGSVPVIVTSVASEESGGLIRVELTIEEGLNELVPIQHGLTGTVKVGVDRTSPLVVVLRLVGKYVN